MEYGSRDLLVVSKLAELSEAELQKELHLLNEMLFVVESVKTRSIVNEVIDVNRYKIIRKPKEVLNAISLRRNKPFVFISNKN